MEVKELKKISRTELLEMLLQQVVGEGSAQELIRGEFDINEALQVREALFSQAEARVEDIVGGADGRSTVTGTIDLTACFASALPGRPVVCSQHSLPFEKAVTLSGEMGEMPAAVATPYCCLEMPYLRTKMSMVCDHFITTSAPSRYWISNPASIR